MKKLLLLFVLLFSASVSAQAPSKAFDVRNGNNIVDSAITQPFATYIVYQDNAKKNNVIDALCDLGNYDALDPATRPTRQNFANNEIRNWLKDKVRANRERIAAASVPPVDITDLP